MKKSRFSEEQITFALRQAEAGVKVKEVCRQLGVSEPTFYNWKAKFGGMGVTELRRLRLLEQENAHLKKLVADLSLDRQMLQDVIKKAVKPAVKKELVKYMTVAYQVSIKKACAALPMHRSALYYKPHKRDEALLVMRMREIAYTRIRFGFERIVLTLRREGFTDNHKRLRRIYREQGLNLRTKRPSRNRSGQHRVEKVEAVRANQTWSMDFVADQLFDGRKFRILTIVDNFSKKCPGLFAGQSIKGADVVNFLETAVAREGAIPERIQVDNGSEFISKELDRWAYENKVVLAFSRPGKPTDNPYIESFNGKFRDECLSTHWFNSLDDVRGKIEEWRNDYNGFRPHYSLSGLTPNEFLALQQNRPEALVSR